MKKRIDDISRESDVERIASASANKPQGSKLVRDLRYEGRR